MAIQQQEVKLFNRWSFDDVEVSDMSLADYIAVTPPKHATYLPQTAGRYSAKRFRKAQCPIIERLTNSLMMHGQNNGKKLMAVCIIKHAMEIIHLLTDANPIQIVVDAIINSVACAQREHVALMQAQRKFQIAHYGRTPAKIEELAGSIECPGIAMSASQEEKKCSFITLSSDPVYVAYHDEEWGVPVHEDRVLFELLVLTGAQVGMDWTTILKKRNEFRVAFAEFDAESVSKFTEKQMVSISVELKLDLGRGGRASSPRQCMQG
ncbi:hypothetical protein ZIOFF_050786 [Zingiber officinale]|uniref:Small ribosomal subunit protein uS7 domain-containing protein n=1 Tax=Zingiber officinale TaxID=94328 RepID=A0A8J5KTV0_ZINOF|nr:hypothetical protein ZIOFF_050786 [Zingiber officinale]